MCTAFHVTKGEHYFGRNLDLDRSYGESVCVMPRRFPIKFREMGEMQEHYGMIGMATVVEGVPLFYDAANEQGLSMAGLHFPGNAFYGGVVCGKDNIASFEVISWILGQCKTVSETKKLLANMNLTNQAFCEKLPPAPLHWIVCDRDASIVIEGMEDGVHIYDNPVGVLTNNPPFERQLANWEQYHALRNDNGKVVRGENLPYEEYCQGLGAVGLPGDVSSKSRFVRMAFGKKNAVFEENECSAVGQMFHLLSSVEMLKGICKTDEGTWDMTWYSTCINTTKGRYYYTTYENRQISCVDLWKENLDGNQISSFPLQNHQNVSFQN